MVDFVCVGMSHVHSVLEAYLERQRSGTDSFGFRAFILDCPPYAPGLTMQDEKWVFNARFDADLVEHVAAVRPSVIFASLLGADHFHLGFLASPRPFDVLIPGEDPGALRPDAELIPFDLMLETCAHAMGTIAGWLVHLRELTGLPICQVAPPPPIAGDDFLQATAVEELSSMIQGRGISPQALRAKIWRICLQAMERHCAHYQVPVIRPPGEVFDETGCLQLRYRGHDAVHANTAYGSVMLDLMAGIADRHVRGKAA